MRQRSLQAVVTRSVLCGMVAGLSACGAGGGTSSTPASASAQKAEAGLAAAPASAPRMAGPLPATLRGVVGNGPFIVVDQFGYLPGLKKVAVLRNPVNGFDSADQYAPGAKLQVVDTATNTVVFSGSPTRGDGS